ncbi:MAG: hypothetical protein HC880_01570 [Bacteroidia bacterium]|nr:hypothetical protein [Bacteroidia bacterium]
MNTTNTNGIELKPFLLKIVSKWYYFVLAAVFALSFAYYKVKSTEPTYRYDGLLLIDDKQTGSKGAAEILNVIQRLDRKKNLINEIGVVSSLSLIRKVVDNLNFKISYYVGDESGKNEIYGEGVPILVKMDTLVPQLIDLPIYVDVISADTYRLHIDSEDKEIKQYDFTQEKIVMRSFDRYKVKKNLQFGQRYKDKFLNFRILKNNDLDKYIGQTLQFKIHNPDQVARKYKSNLKAEQAFKDSYIIGLSVEGKVPRKEADFLDNLMETFIELDLNEKNREGRQALALFVTR